MHALVRELLHVRTGRNRLVKKALRDSSLIDEECSRHSQGIAPWNTKPVPKDGFHSPKPNGWTQDLFDARAIETECLLKRPARITDPLDIIHAELLEERFREILRGEVNEHDSRTASLNIGSLSSGVTHRFTTKRSAEMPQENDQQRRLVRKIPQ